MSVEIFVFRPCFPTSWIYGNGRVFSLNCTCREAMQLENYMTVRMGYPGRGSNAMTPLTYGHGGQKWTGTICPEAGERTSAGIRR